MSFRDISRRSGSSRGSSKSTPSKRQLSDDKIASVAVGRTQKQGSLNNSLHSCTGTFSIQDVPSYQPTNSDTIADDQHLKLSQQREQDYAIQLMREREQELQDINHKMHVVNEIYKDLGEVVDQQQEQIDTIENQFARTADNTRRGLEQLEKANAKGNNKNNKKQDGEEGDAEEVECQFFILKYIQNKMNSIGKMMSVCGGSATTSYSLGENDR